MKHPMPTSPAPKKKRQVREPVWTTADELPPPTSLDDRELKHDVGSLLKLLRTNKGPEKLEWMMARVAGWRYDVAKEQFWYWDRKDFKTKIYSQHHPRYVADLNAVAMFEQRLDARHLDVYQDRLEIMFSVINGRFPKKAELLRVSAAHRCVGLVATHIKVIKLMTQQAIAKKKKPWPLGRSINQAWDWLYPASV